MTDDIGHELLGWCDEKSGAYRPDVAGDIWPYIRRCYQGADRILGGILDRCGEADTTVLSADHGMAGCTHLVHVNDALASAGLAAVGSDGNLDPRRSRVVYHPADNGSLWAADEGDHAAARQAMAHALAVVRTLCDPRTGQRVVRGFLDASGSPLRDEAAPPPVVFLVPDDDYQPTALPSPGGATVRRQLKTGAHLVYTGDSRLHAVHAAVGPGIGAGVDLGTIDNTMVAQLVLRQLGTVPITGGPVTGGPVT
jgi:hypothetical protein